MTAEALPFGSASATVDKVVRFLQRKGRAGLRMPHTPCDKRKVVGHSLKNDLKVLEAYDMTTEAVVAKLMWILGQTHRRDEVERLFYTPVARDILWPAN